MKEVKIRIASHILILDTYEYSVFSPTLLTNEQFLDQIFWLMVPTWQFPRVRLHCFSTADLVTQIPLGQHEFQPGKSGDRIWAAQLLVGLGLQEVLCTQMHLWERR